MEICASVFLCVCVCVCVCLCDEMNTSLFLDNSKDTQTRQQDTEREPNIKCIHHNYQVIWLITVINHHRIYQFIILMSCTKTQREKTWQVDCQIMEPINPGVSGKWVNINPDINNNNLTLFVCLFDDSMFSTHYTTHRTCKPLHSTAWSERD